MSLFRILILLILAFTATLSFSFFKRPRDYTTMAKEIRAQVEKKLIQKHQMECVGKGGGMMGSVYLLTLIFRIHHPLDRNEARVLIVDCAEELLAAVNKSMEIRPFLKDYPFSSKNVHISILSDYGDGREVFDPLIRAVSVYESDYIYFHTKEPGKIPYKSVYKESYQEALAFVKNNQFRINEAVPDSDPLKRPSQSQPEAVRCNVSIDPSHYQDLKPGGILMHTIENGVQSF